MNTRKFSEAMGEIDNQYIQEAVEYQGKRAQKKSRWIQWGALAACLCLLCAGGIMLHQNSTSGIPDPAPVQIANPILKVESVEDMEAYLDFDVPVLDKEIASYSIFVEDSYPTMGQITYADGSEFRMQYGSGDISGIFGGTLVEQKEVGGVTVSYYQYEDATYAIWEHNGFTFSYRYTASNIDSELEVILQQLR